jgi:hypothetical protein
VFREKQAFGSTVVKDNVMIFYYKPLFPYTTRTALKTFKIEAMEKSSVNSMLLKNPKVLRCDIKAPPSFLNQLNAAHNFTSCFPNIYFKIIHLSVPSSPKFTVSSKYSEKKYRSYALLIYLYSLR